MHVSINISAREFRQESFVQQVESCLEQFEVPFGTLKIELKESILAEEIEQVVTTMQALTALGVLIELDQFGAGYTSLKYVNELPLSRLKIDKSFVNALSAGQSATILIRAVVALAGALGLSVMAVGVDNELQFRLLLREGCTQFQGNFFARPMAIANFEFAQRHRTL